MGNRRTLDEGGGGGKHVLCCFGSFHVLLTYVNVFCYSFTFVLMIGEDLLSSKVFL